jgi:hypothetical protein
MHVKYNLLLPVILYRVIISYLMKWNTVQRQIQRFQGLLLLALKFIQKTVSAIFVGVLGRCLSQITFLGGPCRLRRLHVDRVLTRTFSSLKEEELV